jgi:glycosyltransferase involved in cell wall biosynthesis
MNVLLYRRSLDVRSGTGQLMLMQAAGLRAAGAEVRIACERGALRFLLRTGWPVRRMTAPRVAAMSPAPDRVLVDHGACLLGADVVFVHNVLSEASRHVRRDDWAGEIARERAFFTGLPAQTPLVANSQLTKAALIEHFGLAAERIVVHYPGYRSARFTPEVAARLRPRTRDALRVADGAPLVGFVTSGDFQTRGLDLFLASAERIAARRPDARFLVVGSKRLPEWANRHPLVAAGTLLHRPKSGHPQRWFAALDIFLYPARFEEFGMVVAEAQAMGLPVITSRRVGAAECLPPEYTPWLDDAPDAAALAEKTLALLGDPAAGRRLTAAGLRSIAAHDDRAYAEASVVTILDQKR